MGLIDSEKKCNSFWESTPRNNKKKLSFAPIIAIFATMTQIEIRTTTPEVALDVVST